MSARAAHHDDEALKHYLDALRLDPKRSNTLHNIGLIYKCRGAWKESLEFNRGAQSFDPDDEAINWNWAIAATALRDWVRASI